MSCLLDRLWPKTMTRYFLSLLLILAGGILPMFLRCRFRLMKTSAIALLCAGCGLGLGEAIGALLQGRGPATVSLAWLNILTLSFSLDALSAFFLVPVFLISGLAALYSYHYLEYERLAQRVAAGYFFYALLTVSMALVATAANIITFALAWELMSLSSFFLVLFDYESKQTRQAAYLYLLFAQAGALFLFAAFGIIYAQTGNLGFAGLSALPEGVKLLVFVLAFIGFASKAGVFPVHIWLPQAHPAAPSHVSAVMSGVMIKMGIYGMVRIYELLEFSSMPAAGIVIAAGIASGVLGVVYALGQHNLKRLLAYHSTENIGIILIGLGLGMLGAAANHPALAFFGFTGGLLHVLNHAIFKSLLFMGAGSVLHKTGTVVIDKLGGLLKRMRTTGAAFLIGSLAISGLPPFNGFISEFLIYFGAFHGARSGGVPFLLVVAAIVSLAAIGGLAISCFTKVVGIVFLGEPRSEHATRAAECGPTMRAPMLFLALACLLIGLLPQFFVAAAAAGAAGLPGVAGYPAADFTRLAGHITAACSLFLLLLLLVYCLRRISCARQPAPSSTWGCGYTRPSPRIQYTATSFAASIIGFYRGAVTLRETYTGINEIFPARTAYHSEIEDIADLATRKGLVRPALRLMNLLRWIQHGNIQIYIGYIVLAIIVLLLLNLM